MAVKTVATVRKPLARIIPTPPAEIIPFNPEIRRVLEATRKSRRLRQADETKILAVLERRMKMDARYFEKLPRLASKRETMRVAKIGKTSVIIKWSSRHRLGGVGGELRQRRMEYSERQGLDTASYDRS